MKLLEKMEILLNALLFKLGEFLWKLVPDVVRKKFHWVGIQSQRFKLYLKSLPAFLKVKIVSLITYLKSTAAKYNVKSALQDSYQKALTRYKESSKSEKTGKLKTALMAPFLVMGQWLHGLSAGQSMLLLTFSAGSFLAVLGIFFSGQRLAVGQSTSMRTPASVEEEVLYERPDYYKKQTRHFTITNLRLPVYVAQVNEIRSVDVDFTATLTNRYSRLFLEKNEFQLRDHLILQLEPSIAAFPLEEEGKIIIRKKLLTEINDFLRLNEVEGEVSELKITYVLAN